LKLFKQELASRELGHFFPLGHAEIAKVLRLMLHVLLQYLQTSLNNLFQLLGLLLLFLLDRGGVGD
jgi:high-affinity nickel permease